MTVLTDLPEDVLTIIFPFLDAKSFLALCRTCKDIYQYRQEPAFWRTATSSTFRLPISPLLKAEGARWYWLYKRLLTQTTLYTWGEGIKGNLGPGRPIGGTRGFRGRRLHPERRSAPNFQRTSSTWPTETHIPDEVRVIADLQCGGWSTSILSSEGKLYTVGSIDSLDFRNSSELVNEFKQLEYPNQSTSAIRQFSSGRAHILALTDDGDILSWDRIDTKALKLISRSGRNFSGKPTRVVAGWGESSAYIPDIGIVFWTPVRYDGSNNLPGGCQVKEKVIPGTSRHASRDGFILETVAHVVLEAWIVWVTNDSRLMACSTDLRSSDQLEPTEHPFEVPGYSSTARSLQDVQGQFNKFAVFTDNGEVLAGSTEYLRACAERARANPSVEDRRIPAPSSEWRGLDDLIATKPLDIPALQHNQVISVAFGDHHYHALHINGTITSYNTDPKSVGALGLGNINTGSRLRGVKTRAGIQADSKLLPLAERRGRQVWFEPEKRDWLKYMEEVLREKEFVTDETDDRGNRRPAMDLFQFDDRKMFMFSEWVEQEGRHWSNGPLSGQDVSTNIDQTRVNEHDFHLDPYFAIAVSAAGWHSGALVLVDEDRADVVRQKWITKVSHDASADEKPPTMPGHFETGPSDPEEIYVWKTEGFPKIKLPSGYEMPGHGNIRPWRDGTPTLAELDLE